MISCSIFYKSESAIKTGKGDLQKGAMTLEAALTLPLLLCVFLSIVFIIKAVYTYELVNHALDEAASEIASASYIYHVSGIRDLHDTARNSLNDQSEVFKGQLGTVFDTYDSLKNIKSSMDQGLGRIEDSAALLQDADRNFNEMLDSAENVASDPLKELKSIAGYIASGAFNDAKTQLFTPVLKHTMKKYFITEDITDADKRLKQLNVEGGYTGLDFSESSFLADREDNIDIVVRYRIRLPLPVQFIPGLNITQRVKVKAWMDGDETTGVLEGSKNADDLWSMSNFQRGLKIRRLFGGDLPSNFPVIASFSNGKAIMIKSVDMTAPSYQKGDNVQELLNGYIEELAGFKGQDKPFGSGKIIINRENIKTRELLLVIPQNKLTQANEDLLDSFASKAEAKDIALVVKRYGMKADKEETGGETGSDPADMPKDETNEASDTTDPASN
jgi:hypothetical protein